MESRSLDIAVLREAVSLGRVQWQRHALERLIERNIRRSDVIQVILEGDRIEDYPQDYPWPSALFLGWTDRDPLHVVVAFNPVRGTAAIITVYEPTPDHFEADFRTRKRR